MSWTTLETKLLVERPGSVSNDFQEQPENLTQLKSFL